MYSTLKTGQDRWDEYPCEKRGIVKSGPHGQHGFSFSKHGIYFFQWPKKQTGNSRKSKVNSTCYALFRLKSGRCITLHGGITKGGSVYIGGIRLQDSKHALIGALEQ